MNERIPASAATIQALCERAEHALNRGDMAEAHECAAQAVALGYGTLVLQAGEDYGVTREAIFSIVRRVKSETPLAVTLSLGERPEEDLLAWTRALLDLRREHPVLRHDDFFEGSPAHADCSPTRRRPKPSGATSWSTWPPCGPEAGTRRFPLATATRCAWPY